MKTIAIYLLVCVVLAALAVIAFIDISTENRRRWEHNTNQVAECRALGGFAKTDARGGLEACAFPQK